MKYITEMRYKVEDVDSLHKQIKNFSLKRKHFNITTVTRLACNMGREDI